jgi:hypothetical protein
MAMAEERKVSPILGDRPAEEDALGFAPYRDILVEIVASPDSSGDRGADLS